MLSSDVGIIIVDHGSRRDAANEMLLDVVKQFKEATDHPIVEAAHMELAEPTIANAFRRCVEQGATRVVVHPYFLSPGRHSTTDIPEMTSKAAGEFPHVSYTVTEPLGIDERMMGIILRRIEESLGIAASRPQ